MRKPDTPTVTVADITAGMHEHGIRSMPLVGGASGRKMRAAIPFGAKLDKLLGGCEPAQLHPVIVILIAQHGAVRQRHVDEVPHMRVLFVEITNRGKEPAELDIKAARQGRGLYIAFFDIHTAFRCDGCDHVTEKQIIDIRADA